jgi:hypothetical protein
MNISPIGSAATYVPPARSQQGALVRASVSATVGGDSDGDNDGSKGSTVDVRA